MYFFMDTVASGASFANFKAFIVDLKELVARGGSFLPSLELDSRRLPREFRRLLRPLKAFPALKRELRPALSAVPEWITAKLEAIVGGRHLKK